MNILRANNKMYFWKENDSKIINKSKLIIQDSPILEINLNRDYSNRLLKLKIKSTDLSNSFFLK